MRPDIDAYFMRIAGVVATRSTCLRRAVGCVLVDSRKHILATGYNGVAVGQPHCNEPSIPGAIDLRRGVNPYDPTADFPHACPGAGLPSGVGLDVCGAIHAEQNALLQCRDVYAIEACYVTTQPCVSCLKLLLATTCKRIVYGEAYAGGDLALWERAGRHANQFQRFPET